MDSIPLVPFGKYKGQPVTNLINDTQYLEFCKKQKWFQDYPIVYNICVNQTITSGNALNNKTPEHNRLQNLFLKQENIKQLISFLKVKYYGTDPTYDNIQYDKITIEFEAEFNWDVTIKTIASETNDTLDFFPNIYIEIKPLMGDDYPCVLRKIKTQKDLTIIETRKKFENYFDYRKSYETKCILFLQEFSSTNTTKEEVIAIFRQSNIRIVFFQDVFKPDSIQPLENQKKRKVDSEPIVDSKSTAIAVVADPVADQLMLANAKIQQLEQEIVLLKQQLEQQKEEEEKNETKEEQTNIGQHVMPPNIRSYFGGCKPKITKIKTNK